MGYISVNTVIIFMCVETTLKLPAEDLFAEVHFAESEPFQLYAGLESVIRLLITLSFTNYSY